MSVLLPPSGHQRQPNPPRPHSPTATTFPRCAVASSISPVRYWDSPLCSNWEQRVGWQPTVQYSSSARKRDGVQRWVSDGEKWTLWTFHNDVVFNTTLKRPQMWVSPLPLVSASLRASLLSSRFPPVIMNCNQATAFRTYIILMMEIDISLRKKNIHKTIFQEKEVSGRSERGSSSEGRERLHPVSWRSTRVCCRRRRRASPFPLRS